MFHSRLLCLRCPEKRWTGCCLSETTTASLIPVSSKRDARVSKFSSTKSPGILSPRMSARFINSCKKRLSIKIIRLEKCVLHDDLRKKYQNEIHENILILCFSLNYSVQIDMLNWYSTCWLINVHSRLFYFFSPCFPESSITTLAIFLVSFKTNLSIILIKPNHSSLFWILESELSTFCWCT